MNKISAVTWRLQDQQLGLFLKTSKNMNWSSVSSKEFWINLFFLCRKSTLKPFSTALRVMLRCEGDDLPLNCLHLQPHPHLHPLSSSGSPQTAPPSPISLRLPSFQFSAALISQSWYWPLQISNQGPQIRNLTKRSRQIPETTELLCTRRAAFHHPGAVRELTG